MNRAWTLLLSFLRIASCGCRKSAAPVSRMSVPVRVATVEQVQVGNSARYSAAITSNDQIDLAFKSGEYVSSIHQVRGADGRRRPADVGDFVKAGTVLASVRAGEYLKTTNSGYSLVAQPAAERLYRSY